MDAVMDRSIEGAGTTEADWIGSAFIENAPRVGIERLLGDCRRVVVVAPHPDDEVLGCGGLMMLAADRGRQVVILSVTDGEHCYPGHATLRPAQLRRIRHAELVAAAATLGIGANEIVRLGIADGDVAAERDTLVDVLAAFLAPTDLVCVTWIRDGHPDHEAASHAALAAAEQAGARILQYPVWGWHWMPQGAAAREWPGALRLDLDATTRDGKARAIACFETQLGNDDARIDHPVLAPHVVARFLRSFEIFLP